METDIVLYYNICVATIYQYQNIVQSANKSESRHKGWHGGRDKHYDVVTTLARNTNSVSVINVFPSLSPAPANFL